jgi:hypothetical protein
VIGAAVLYFMLKAPITSADLSPEATPAIGENTAIGDVRA